MHSHAHTQAHTQVCTHTHTHTHTHARAHIFDVKLKLHTAPLAYHVPSLRHTLNTPSAISSLNTQTCRVNANILGKGNLISM
uniref:Uncharacterized protein n=1 Tax=Anguilla anguilla TaxID=7936 RepID=A0A0E9XK13_ANGAN